MGKLNPFFEVDGKTYEIIRTRAIECEYDKIRKENSVDDVTKSLTNDYAKLMLEFEEIGEKFNEAKENFYNDVLNKDKKEIYLAFKELSDSKFKEMKDFELKNKEFSFDKIEDIAYANGVKLLIFALCEQYDLSEKEAISIWNKFEEHYGILTSKQWINVMIQTLFESEDEENPFLKQAQAKAQQRLESRKGLKKIGK